MPTALKYFGGPTLAYETIVQRIKEARLKTELAPEELGELASMANPSQVDDLENSRAEAKDFAASDILALSAQVGLNVERLLPLRHELSQQDESDWKDELDKDEAGPVAAADGSSAIRVGHPKDDRVVPPPEGAR